jgi:signal peptidase I
MTKSDSNVTHRVDEITDVGFITKGDANLSPDTEIVTFDKVKGKVLDFNIPFIGLYINFVNKNLWLVWVVVVILLSEFLLENVKSFKIKKSKKGVENI